MANTEKFNCLEYCNAPISEWGNGEDKIDVKCPCLKCGGDKSSTCETYKLAAKLSVELRYLQRMRCNKCKYYKGNR